MGFHGKHSPETRAKIAAAARNRSPETRAKMAAAARGKTLSPETRAKIAEALARPETRAKIAEALRCAEAKGMTDAEYADFALFRRKGFSKAEAAELARSAVRKAA